MNVGTVCGWAVAVRVGGPRVGGGLTGWRAGGAQLFADEVNTLGQPTTVVHGQDIITVVAPSTHKDIISHSSAGL